MDEERLFRFPDSGQVVSYDREGREIAPKLGDALYGQDGCHIVNPLSFQKLDANGQPLPDTATWESGFRTVLDTNTGLVWEVKSPHPGDANFCEAAYSWQDAKDGYIKALNRSKHGGFDDWRLPNKDELRSIFDYGRVNPALDPWYFPNCPIDFYWCDATYEMQPYFAWVLFSGLGAATAAGKELPKKVLAVRGGYNVLFGRNDLSRFVDNGDGTITDQATALQWQKGENPRASWFDALKACQELRLGGHEDWRLPNIKELNSILNLSYANKSWYFGSVFPAEGVQPPSLHYFSSTVHERVYVWVVNFNFGYDGYYAGKNTQLLFRAVRNVGVRGDGSRVFVLPSTGQTTHYDDEGRAIAMPGPSEETFGQDADLQPVPPLFVKSRSRGHALPVKATWDDDWRMTMDTNTGLCWERKSPLPGDINFAKDRYSWQAAHDYVARLNAANHGGYSDWRLPNREELRSMVNYRGMLPAVDAMYFPETASDFYWCKDVYAADTKLAWGVYAAYGCCIAYPREASYLVRAVRGGHNFAFGDATRYALSSNDDGTATDHNCSLMWKQDESPPMTMNEALKYCRNLELAGHRDWRLPSIRELGTLIDVSFKDGVWFHRSLFPETVTKPQGFYMSSSTFGGSFLWGVNFQFGYDGYYGDKKNGRYPFRPVRRVLS